MITGLPDNIRSCNPESISGTPGVSIPFRNDASETVPSFGIMRMTGVVPKADTNGMLTFKMDKPNGIFQPKWYVNGPLSVESGKFGSCMDLSLYGYALFDTGTPAHDEGWGPKPSQWKLYKGFYGFRAIGNTNSNSKIGVFRQTECLCVYGKADAAIEYHDTGTVSVWSRASSAVGSEADTGFNLENVGNWCVKSSKSIASGDEVWVHWVDNCWRIYQTMECPA